MRVLEGQKPRVKVCNSTHGSGGHVAAAGTDQIGQHACLLIELLHPRLAWRVRRAGEEGQQLTRGAEAARGLSDTRGDKHRAGNQPKEGGEVVGRERGVELAEGGVAVGADEHAHEHLKADGHLGVSVLWS